MPYMVTEDGTPIYYADYGPRSAAAIVLLHGEPFNSLFWAHNIEALAERFHVVTMDVRGRGRSGKTEYGQSIAQFARDAHLLFERLNLTQILLVGWSLGSAIGWSYMEQFGQQALRGFVNVDQPPYRYVSDEHLEASRAAVREHRLEHHLASINRYLGPDSGVDEETVRWMAYECMKTHTSSHSAIITDAYLADFRPQLAAMQIPNQFYWASFGAVRREMANYVLKTAPNCESVFFDNCGHLIPWVKAAQFNAELAKFAVRTLAAPATNGG
jgi:pimeloyl-ACP methyl ester carboxylesterase